MFTHVYSNFNATLTQLCDDGRYELVGQNERRLYDYFSQHLPARNAFATPGHAEGAGVEIKRLAIVKWVGKKGVWNFLLVSTFKKSYFSDRYLTNVF